MSITIDVDPPLQAALSLRADSAGVSLENYVLRVLELDAKIVAPEYPVFSDAMRRLEQCRGKLGPIPDAALDPELLYGNR